MTTPRLLLVTEVPVPALVATALAPPALPLVLVLALAARGRIPNLTRWMK